MTFLDMTKAFKAFIQFWHGDRKKNHNMYPYFTPLSHLASLKTTPSVKMSSVVGTPKRRTYIKGETKKSQTNTRSCLSRSSFEFRLFRWSRRARNHHLGIGTRLPTKNKTEEDFFQRKIFLFSLLLFPFLFPLIICLGLSISSSRNGINPR